MLASRPRGVLTVTVVALLAAGCKSGTEPNGPGLDLGEIRPTTNGNSITLAGGADGQDFVIAASNVSTSFAGLTSVTFTGSGLDVAPPAKSLAPSGPSLLRFPGQSSPMPDDAFELSLRHREMALQSRFAAARQWYASRSTRAPGLSLDAIPANVNVGDKLSLNVSLALCDNADNRGGRVVAITQKAIVVADTLNPANGFTDAEYASIGAMFDTLVAPVNEAAFGQPADVDNNHHVVLFFTRAVNEMTERGSQSVVGGFFYGRDLFPTTSTATLEGCPTSNVGEMFYLLVPDPTGLVSDARSKEFVERQTIATTGHEYQHLINASRRLYVVPGNANFETVWLNEGLSHVAEELLFFHVAKMTPRQNVDITALRPKNNDPADTMRISAFNRYENFNFGRYRVYLDSTTKTSPYAPNDELSTRGATWSLLRFLADHRGSSDGDTWSKLVNTTQTGLTNLQTVFGNTLTEQIRAWQVSVDADDYPLAGGSVASDYSQPSWNFRSVYTGYQTASPFPLKPEESPALADAAPVTVTLNGGSVAFLRLSVAANQTATVTWSSNGSAPPATFQVTTFRTR